MNCFNTIESITYLIGVNHQNIFWCRHETSDSNNIVSYLNKLKEKEPDTEFVVYQKKTKFERDKRY